MILGRQMVRDVTAIELDGSLGIDDFTRRLKSWFDSCTSRGGVLILADLFGGSPCNAALALAAESGNKIPVKVVSGTNLGMLIEVLMEREQGASVEQLSATAERAGKEAVVDATQRLMGQDERA